MRLTEGLRAGDLKELVLPLISIDEYKSKLGNDDDVIVVAFFLLDEDPAYDLSSFIEKGSNKLLDTEPSPAPNEDGYYLVFVEYIRDMNFPEKLIELIEEIKLLVDVDKWVFKPYKHSKTVDLTEKNLRKFITLKEKDKKNQKESISNFLKNSFLNEYKFNGETLIVESFQKKLFFKYIDFGNDFQVIKENGLSTKLRLDEDARWKKVELKDVFGSDWDINLYGDYVSLGYGDQILLLKPF